MKTIIVSVSAFLCLFSSLRLQAQNQEFPERETRTVDLVTIKNKKFLLEKNPIITNLSFSSQRKKPMAITNTTVTDVSLGCANAIWSGHGNPGLPRLDFNQVGSKGVLTMIHNSGPSCIPSDGTPDAFRFMVDISKDGGTTWNSSPSKGPIGSFNTTWGQYPAGMIYNPTNSTNPDSVFLTYIGGGGTNNVAWNLHHSGATRLYNPAVYKHTASFFTNLNFKGYCPETFADDGIGNNYYLDLSRKTILGAYNDTIIIRKGIWNGVQRQFAYLTTKLPFPVVTDSLWYGEMIDDVNVSANGQTVYIAASALGEASFVAPDTLYYITVWKSTNGGTSWSSPYKISMDVNTQMGTVGEKYSSANHGLDGAVDSLGNYHIILGIQNWFTGEQGEFSIVTNGTSNTKTLLDKPMTVYGAYGSPVGLMDHNRGQIALSPNREKVFYVWFDTDTTKFSTFSNQNPDAISRLCDVKTMSFSPKNNLTSGSIADGKMTLGFVANWASSGVGCGGDPYKVHLGYMEAVGSYSNPFIYHYVGGYCEPQNLVGILNPQEFEIMETKIFPNPTNGKLNLEINLMQAETIHVSVFNLLGQLMYSSSEQCKAGIKLLMIDAMNWQSGVYFLKLKSGDITITKKIIKE